MYGFLLLCRFYWGREVIHCHWCICIMSFSTSFFLIFRKLCCLWQELVPAVARGLWSCLHNDPHPWYDCCLIGFAFLMATSLPMRCHPVNARFIALLWLQQAVQCGELTGSDHRLDHANIITSCDFFFPSQLWDIARFFRFACFCFFGFACTY